MADPRQSHNKISRLIDSSRLNEAFLSLLNQLVTFNDLTSYVSKLRKLEDTYIHMLNYIADGFVDESKQELILNIKEELKRANDLLLKNTLLKDSPDVYSSTLRMIKLNKISLSELIRSYLELNEKEQGSNDNEANSILSEQQLHLLRDIFNYTWTMFGNDSEDPAVISSALMDITVPDILKNILISAILLGNISYFDYETLKILFDIYEITEIPELKAKIVTAISIITILHYDRIGKNRHLTSRISSLKENPGFKKDMKEVVYNLLMAYDTKRVTNKMKDEVIPGLMKMRPDIIDRLKDLSSDSDDFLSDANPKWEEILENSGISDKLQELNDMQMEGMDVMMTTFSNLKNFPFFNDTFNWFIPFLPSHPYLSGLEVLTQSETVSRFRLVMCDSDIYSFLFSLKSMPESQRAMMFSRMENQMKEAAEVLKPQFNYDDKFELSKRIKFGIQDLYRFFKLYRKKGDFFDPFENPINASQAESLISLYDLDDEILSTISEFYFKYGYFKLAAPFLQLITERNPEASYLWEKLGYCYQKNGQYNQASDWYLKASIINPDSLWLNKNLALTLRKAGKPSMALEFYTKALEKEPENFHLLMSMGQTLLETEDYKKALEYFYHSEYLKPSSKSPSRAIAWAELLAGNNDKAMKKYAAILASESPDKVDFLNAGHAALASGDFKNAVGYYSEFIDKTENKNITELIIALRDDSDILKKLNIKTSDLRLLVDKIRYNSQY